MFNFVEPVLYLWAMGFGLGTYVTQVNGLSYLDFFGPGPDCLFRHVCHHIRNDLREFHPDEFSKNLSWHGGNPVSMDDVIMGEILYGTFKGVLYGMVFFAVVAMFGVVKSFWALFLPIPLALMVAVFSVLSLIWTSFAPNYDSFGYFFTLFISPMFLFAGVFFPIDNLPAGIRFLPWLTPLYHAVEVIRPLILGQVRGAMIGDLVWLALFLLLTIRLPLVLVKNRLIQ